MPEIYLDKEDTAFVYDTDRVKLWRLDGEERVPVTNPESAAKIVLRSVEISAEEAARLARIPFFGDAES